MGSRNKDDDRFERTIRSLMRLPENRRCVNCNNLGPQYVCTTFSTFVCMNCSGIHREFTHRVKSVSMAKFTADEVAALQAGGNERTRQVFFRHWDVQRHCFPDSSDLNRLRDFIKHVYVDRRYASERSSTGPQRLPSVESYQGRGSYDEGMYEKSFAGRFGKNDGLPGKPHYSHQKNLPLSVVYPWSRSQKKNPVRFEVVDDRVRDDRLGSRRFSQGDMVLQRRLSYANNANMESSDPPAVQPLEEILGRNLPALRVCEISKRSNKERADRSARNQDSATGKPQENKVETSQSLIDFDTETEPSKAIIVLQTQQTSPLGSGSSQASPESQSSSKGPQATKVKTLESLLFELSVPVVNSKDDLSGIPGGGALPTVPTSGVALPAPTQQIPQLIDSLDGLQIQPPNDDLLLATSSNDTAVEATDEWPFESVLQTEQSVLAGGSSSYPQPTTSIGAPNNETSFASLVHNELRSSSVLPEKSSRFASRPVQDAIAEAVNQSVPEETKSSRMALPEDLFTATYPSISGWQTCPPLGMGYNYYHNTTPVPAFPNQAKSTNPFDITDELSQFPSTASLQLTLPQSHPNAYLMAQQSPYVGPAFSPRSYVGQEVHNNIQTARPQVFSGSMIMSQRPAAIFSEHTNPNSSMGGNPFG